MRRITISALLGAALLAGSALAAPPTDEDIQELMGAMRQYWMEHREEEEIDALMKVKAAELLAEIEIADCAADDIEGLGQVLTMAEEYRLAALARLAMLAEAEDAAGAHAAVVRMSLLMQGTDAEKSAALRAALRHPGFGAMLAEGNAGRYLGSLPYVGEDVLRENAADLVAISRFFNEDLPDDVLPSLSDYVVAVNSLGDTVDKRTREEMRQKVVALMTAAHERLKTEDERMASWLERRIAFLDGAYARGELIGYPAPKLALSWSSDAKPATTLADYKGKVVVLDFWATWCGPCVASFPNMRELQERYNGYDVVILGVTSLQGKHYPGGGASPVDTEGDPAKEYALMKEFMGQKEMTWSVAFSEQDVFNPDYGVNGIPHVAIVDAKGVVRFNGLHPMDPAGKKTAKIDGLLAEAGLPHPAPLVDAEEAEGAKGG